MGDVGLGPGQITGAAGERRREIPGEAIRRREAQRLVDILAGDVGMTQCDLGAGTVELGLGALWIRQAGYGKRRVEVLQRTQWLAGGEPGIARLDPEIGAAPVAGRSASCAALS